MLRKQQQQQQQQSSSNSDSDEVGPCMTAFQAAVLIYFCFYLHVLGSFCLFTFLIVYLVFAGLMLFLL